MYTQNWDGVSPGSIPSDFTVDAPATTKAAPLSGGISPISGTQVLGLVGAGNNTQRFATYGIPDSAAGVGTVSGYFAATSLGNVGSFGLTARGNVPALIESSSTFYWVLVDWFSAEILLEKVVAGSVSSLSTLFFSGLAADAWYRPALAISTAVYPSITLSFTLERVSDGYWLNSSGTFQSASATAISFVDWSSPITGAGYWGASLQSRSATLYHDDWSLDAAAPPAPGLGLGTQRAPIWRPPSRKGRIWLPANPGPFVAPPPVFATPLHGLMVRPDPAKPLARRHGTASVGRLTPASALPPAGPLIATTRPIGIPVAHRRGRVLLPGWLTPPPPPTITPPGLGTLTPAHRREPAPHRGRATGFPDRTLGATPDWAAFAGGILRPVAGVREPARSRGATNAGRWGALVTQPVTLPPLLGLSGSVLRPHARRERVPRPTVPVWVGFSHHVNIGPGVFYDVYANAGDGGPIDYTSPVAIVTATTWTTFGLAYPGDWWFAVRALNQCGEEKNLDCAVEIILDANGQDITNRPAPPTGLRAIPTAGGGIKVEWFYGLVRGPKRPSGFHVYLGTGGTPDYTSPVASVAYSSGFANAFQVTIPGLADGVTYTIGVRAYNSSEEANTATVSCVADATGPGPVTDLIGIAIV